MLNAVELAVFSGQIKSICEEMGLVLQRSAFSPNIKDRLDYSCAFFDSCGKIVAQAAHIPVHLGSMAFAMTDIVANIEWLQGDVLVLNDPFKGGTHLPDVTIISPFFVDDVLTGFVVNRAHHANIGCESPGSMPLSSSLEQEGVVISPRKLYRQGNLDRECATLLAGIEGRSDCDLPGDFVAQVSANLIGLERLDQWFREAGLDRSTFLNGIDQLNEYGKTLAMEYFTRLPNGKESFHDFMDSDGISDEPIRLEVMVSICDGSIELDFVGTSAQVGGNLNCPLSVCAASVYYVFASLLPSYVPHCDGVFRMIKIAAPKGSVLNALPGAAVTAGNVETSMRIVDIVLGALHKIGLDVPAASQGTMNNVAMGGRGNEGWNYYETLAGGSGAGKDFDGLSATQCHMTNTLNTPVESLEIHYPLQIREYSIRAGSGGAGLNTGGDGLVRAYRFLGPAQVTLLTERRSFAPWGLRGAGDGKVGANYLNGINLPPKAELSVEAGDVLSVETPGGGGWGRNA